MENDKQTNDKAFCSSFVSIFIHPGIPVHAILFAYMGDFFGKTVSAWHSFQKLFPFITKHFSLWNDCGSTFSHFPSSWGSIIATKSTKWQQIATGCRRRWAWLDKSRSTWFPPSSCLYSSRPCCSHTSRTGTTQSRSIMRSSRWQP